MGTRLARSLTSHSYMIGSIIQKLLKSRIFYGYPCGDDKPGGGGSPCG